MTHTLNRRGISEDRSGQEIIVLCMVHHKEKEQKQKAMEEAACTVLRHNPDNVIGLPMGMNEKDIPALSARTGIVTAVFNDPQDVLSLVKELKAKKLGISVVLSGLFGDVRKICAGSGLTEHTANISLGIFGRTERLPEEPILEITTQCGHALVSPHLVKHIVRQIRKGKMTPEEGARKLVKPCVCGIVNPQRTERILERLAKRRG